jgi:hypothetical protein
MLPVDLNILIGILIVIVIFAYVLILKKLKQKPVLTKKIDIHSSKKYNSKAKIEDKNVEKAILQTIQTKPPRSTCAYHFGFLRSLPKNSRLPDKCLGCQKIVECLTFE